MRAPSGLDPAAPRGAVGESGALQGADLSLDSACGPLRAVLAAQARVVDPARGYTAGPAGVAAVSYTHLTLPTIYSV